jgi:N-acylneuraminate cytidylyltransferase
MIAWSIEHAKSIKRIRRVIVSTDSEEIASVAREFGAETPFIRPPELARDDSPEWLAWRHALNYLLESEGILPDVMVSVPVTAPLRSAEDIEKCLDEFGNGEPDAVVTVSEAHRSPFFNMVKRDGDGTVSLVIPSSSTIARRQDAPAVFDMTTVAYVVSPPFVLAHNSLFEGRVRAVTIPHERAIDIDTLLDFQIAEFLMEQGHNNNQNYI